MRILYGSDFHLETRARSPDQRWTTQYPLRLGPDLTDAVGKVDLYVLAGDTAYLISKTGALTMQYAEQAAVFLGCPVVVVPGNHEYYTGIFDTDRQIMLDRSSHTVTAMDRHERRYEEAGQKLRVLGATLWTDYNLFPNMQAVAMLNAERCLNDHRMIRMSDKTLFSPAIAIREHQLSRQWLLDRLAEPYDGQTLIVTHHNPHSQARNPNFPLDLTACCFVSDLNDVLDAASKAGVVGWIYGHDHWSQNTVVGGVQLLSAQLGYPGENTNFQGLGLIEF